MNLVAMLGTLGRDPELKKTPSGTPYLKNGLGVWRGRAKDSEEPSVEFFNFVAWGKDAEFIANHARKNTKLLIQGSLHRSSYTDSANVTRDFYEISVDKVEFGLRDSSPSPAKVRQMCGAYENGRG